MIQSRELLAIISICFMSFTNVLNGQSNSVKSLISKNINSDTSNIDLVKICKWKNDASTCVNFSFDDNNLSSLKISQIFDSYGYKCTFFVISSYMYVDSLKDICSRGNEIGNHTYSHLDLSQLDSSQVSFQVRKGKELIENTLGIKCVSFAEPGHSKTQLSIAIEQQYELFDRDYSEYSSPVYSSLISTSKISGITNYIKTGIKNGNRLLLDGHGIDGDGYSPITKEFLVQTLDSLKKYSNVNNIWVTSLKEGAQYENLYHEIKLKKSFQNDTLTLSFENYNKEKYKDLDSSLISVEIPFEYCNDISCLTKFVDVKKLHDKFIITTNIKNDTSLVVLLKKTEDQNVLIANVIADSLIIYPNPTRDFLNLKSDDDISLIEIYNPEGKLILRRITNVQKIDILNLPSGLYFIKIETGYKNNKIVHRNRFIKI